MELTKELMNKLSELIEEKRIIEHQHRYLRSVDERDYKGTADCFVENGRVSFTGATRVGDKLVEGRAEIAAWFKEIGDQDFLFARHYIINADVKITKPDKATFSSYYNGLFIFPTYTRVIFGIYDDKLIKEKGEWKLLEKNIRVRWDDNLAPLKEFK